MHLIALEGVLVLKLHDQGVGIFDLGLLPHSPSEPQIVNSGNGREELPRLLQKLRSLGFAEAVLQADQYHVANHGRDVSLDMEANSPVAKVGDNFEFAA